MWRSASNSAGPDVTFTVYVDGNRNGVRTADIQRGLDVAAAAGSAPVRRFSRRRVRHPSRPPVNRQPGTASRRRPDSDRAGQTWSSSRLSAPQRQAACTSSAAPGPSTRCASSPKQAGAASCGSMRVPEPGSPLRTDVMAPLERRRERRRLSSVEHGVLAARVRPGQTVVLIDISTHGAQLETERRLLPGSAVDLLLALQVGGLVVRSRVLALFGQPRRALGSLLSRCRGLRSPHLVEPNAGVCASQMRTRSRPSRARVRTTRTRSHLAERVGRFIRDSESAPASCAGIRFG